MEKKSITSLEDLRGFANEFIEQTPSGGVVGLFGELGAGKTTFVRFCVEAIGTKTGCIVSRVTSPSFVIHQSYQNLVTSVDHFDLYRFDHADETVLLELGYFEIIEKSRKQKGYVFVEWPDRAGDLSLLDLDITLQFVLEEKARFIIIAGRFFCPIFQRIQREPL